MFWGIKRQEKVDDEWNCEIAHQNVMGVIASHDDDSRLGKMGVRFKPSAGTYTATVPVIVNMKDIPANKDVILKWQLQGKKNCGKESGNMGGCRGKRRKEKVEECRSDLVHGGGRAAEMLKSLNKGSTL